MSIDFSTFEELEFPKDNNVLYVLCIRDTTSELCPFYVGESSKHVYGRIGDYVSAKFSASTDFKVGEAVRYLQSKGHRVVVKYRTSDDRKGDESQLIQELRTSQQLLNDLKGYNYRVANVHDERLKIHSFMNQVLETWRSKR